MRVQTDLMRLALVVYDWLISLDEEIHSFWDLRKGRKLTAAAVIYGITRYPLIIANILVLQTAFPMSETVRAQCFSRPCGGLLMPLRRAHSILLVSARVLLTKGCS